jgi:RNA recognition motif-containing protein
MPSATFNFNKINKIFVGGLKVDTTPKEVEDFFSKHGFVKDVQLKYKKNKKDICLGYGIVTMDPSICRKLISREFLDYEGRKIRCSPYLKGD